jgi:hypothetical protein
LDDSEAPMSSEEVIQDYKEQFGSTPVAPKEEGDHLGTGSTGKPLTQCMMGRDAECNHPKCPVTDK